ncbi:alpha/beta fold hydrolase [Bifidobacterium pullorum]|uniref:AB hydrolase-1 domain-containing protein n=1 Tax=Bifidobacterium pullorum subsp. gallinarum TaxID=78344 RepID=A0A921IXQ4_9BIFI|nr:alpha/beta fold hydrolase [Bifidobacterium pullorum]HJG41725.1 hypothetical protein [Bifidobacterium pullorum subsp. gallinarum]
MADRKGIMRKRQIGICVSKEGGLKMRILEYGNTNNPTIMLVHGFESPYQIWIDYIEHYKENYHILVPILPGHDVQEKSEFNSFDDTAKEIENYCISKSINHIYAIYGMSMGGVLTSYLWKNKRLTFEKVILESSPLLPFGKYMTQMLIKQYLSITKKARERNQKVVRNAINTMVTEDMLDVFLELFEYLTCWGPGLLRLGAIMSFGGYCVSRPGLLRLGAVVG